jgi:hypothetical protein
MYPSGKTWDWVLVCIVEDKATQPAFEVTTTALVLGDGVLRGRIHLG